MLPMPEAVSATLEAATTPKGAPDDMLSICRPTCCASLSAAACTTPCCAALLYWVALGTAAGAAAAATAAEADAAGASMTPAGALARCSRTSAVEMRDPS